MKLAEKFDGPIFSFIDTPGAFQALMRKSVGSRTIAYNLREMAKLTVPIIVTVIGEGGSGGALANWRGRPGVDARKPRSTQ